MFVSIIIPTYNGAHKIMGVLRSLEQQIFKPDEVIVVIDGSTDDTAALLREQSFALPNFRIIEQTNGGRANVRNRGAFESNGDLLLFVDDDMILIKEWVGEHVRHHVNFPNSILTGKLEDFGKRKDDFHMFKVWLHKKWSKNLARQTQDSQSVQLKDPYITATNLSLRKILFKRLNGFDNRLKDAEDYDLAKRAMLMDIPLYFSHSAIAMNNDMDNDTCIKYIKRFREYTAAQRLLQSLKPDIHNKWDQNNSNVFREIKQSSFSVLCTKWWINSVDKGTWKWLPKNIRYKLYDMIVTANGIFFPEKVIF